MKKPPLNKWQFVIGFERAWDRMNGYQVSFGIFKFVHYPPEGQTYSKDDHRGFLWQKTFSLPRGFFVQLPTLTNH